MVWDPIQLRVLQHSPLQHKYLHQLSESGLNSKRNPHPGHILVVGTLEHFVVFLRTSCLNYLPT